MNIETKIQSFDNLSVKEKLNILRELQSHERFDEYQSLIEYALQDASAKVRQLAFSVLVWKNRITPEITRALLNDRSKVLRRKALRQMIQWVHPDYLSNIEPFLHDPDISSRLLAIEWISQLGETALPLLQPLLQDPMYSVREKARHYIHEIKKRLPTPNTLQAYQQNQPSEERVQDKPVWATLLERLDPENPRQFQKTITKLIENYPQESIPHILHFLEHNSWEIRDIIVEALCRLETIPMKPLIQYLQHPVWYVRACAIEILGSFGHPALLHYAEQLSKDPNVEVRRALASVLHHYRKKEVTYQILERFTRDEHFVVRREAKKSLSILRQG